MIEAKVIDEGLNLEWVQLILEAKRLGLQIEEIRSFLNAQSSR